MFLDFFPYTSGYARRRSRVASKIGWWRNCKQNKVRVTTQFCEKLSILSTRAVLELFPTLKLFYSVYHSKVHTSEFLVIHISLFST